MNLIFILRKVCKCQISQIPLLRSFQFAGLTYQYWKARLSCIKNRIKFSDELANIKWRAHIKDKSGNVVTTNQSIVELKSARKQLKEVQTNSMKLPKNFLEELAEGKAHKHNNYK